MTAVDQLTCHDASIPCQLSTVKGLEEQSRQQTALLQQAQTACVVALAMGPVAAKFFADSEADRLLLMQDVTRQWHRLTPEEQARYGKRQGMSSVAAFAQEYVESLTREAFAHKRPDGYSHSWVADVAESAYWQHHMTALRDLADGRPIEFQYILVGDYDEGVKREATEEEQHRFNLQVGDMVVELRRVNGDVEVYGCRTWEFKPRRHFQGTARGALLYSPQMDGTA